MNWKEFLILAISCMAGLYVIKNARYQEQRNKLVDEDPDNFNVVGDDGADAVALAGVITLVGIGLAKVGK